VTAAACPSINARTAYDAVERLQPSWLNNRLYTVVGRGDRTVRTPAVGDASGPHVYVGNVSMGSADYLKSVNANDVKEMRYYDAVRATRQFGAGHPRGVIELTLIG